MGLELDELARLQKQIDELEAYKKDQPKIAWYTQEAIELSKQAKDHQGQPLGFKTLDALLGGVSSGELIIISAPTYTGKTAFAQSITWNLAQLNIGSLWYSLEVSIWNFIQPFLKNDPEAKWSPDGTIEKAGHLPIYWPKDVAKLDFEGLRRTIRYAFLKYGIQHVFIDHLHYLLDYKDIDKGSTSMYIGDRLRRLRQIAHETGVSIFLIAHMTKTDDTREPTINDLRDSSFVAQEADAIIVLSRKRLKEPVLQTLIDGTQYELTHSPIAKCKIEKARRTGANGSFDLIFENKLYFDPATSPRLTAIYETLKELYEPHKTAYTKPYPKA